MDQERATPQLTEDNLELWFEMIFSELRHVEASIDATRGWAFIKEHVYTKDEIFSLPAFKKIYALCGQVDDLVGQWRANSSISDVRYKLYHESRIKVERTLGEIRARIVERKSTAWEGLVHVFNYVVQIVMEYLPILPELILRRIGYQPSALKRLTSRVIDINHDDV
jgi:hypothetical protein